MEFENLIKEGKLTEALDSLKESVRKNPTDSQLRIVIFQLYSILAEWEKAARQLAIIGEMSGQLKTFASVYSQAVLCEQFREKVFEGEKKPVVFGKPEEYIASLVTASEMTAKKNYEAASKLFKETTDSFPAISGKINGQKFEWIMDMDNRVGPLFEIIMNGCYYWTPAGYIKTISIAKPSHLIDKVWVNADLLLANGTQITGLMPVRYPLTYNFDPHNDADILLSSKTEWDEVASDYFIGKGQKMFATDNGEFALLDIREIEFDVILESKKEQRQAQDTEG